VTRLSSLALALLASGCASTLAPAVACETPARVEITVASGALLNPDEAGDALPTEIRVLELRDATLFENTSFDDAWAPAAPLSDLIVATHSITLYPGESAALVVAPIPETHAIVGIAIVRRPAGRTWRVIVPIGALPCGLDARLPLLVDEYRIERVATESK
jgi:type VI secretion system VasD/TssJ family lipoprotein